MINEYDNKSMALLTKVYYVPPNADGELVLPANNNRYGIIVSSLIANSHLLLYAYRYEIQYPTLRFSSFYPPYKLTYKDIGEMIKAPFYANYSTIHELPIIEICLPCECRLEIIRDLGL